MTFYARKPHRIEAKQVTMGEITRVSDWCGGTVAYTSNGDAIGVFVPGITTARPSLCALGDYVTCNEHGEYGVIEAFELAVEYDLARDPARA